MTETATQNWLIMLIIPAVSLLIGAFITVVVTRIYYIKAAKDLKTKTIELQKLIKISLRALEEAGIAELTQDESGQIKGVVKYGSTKESTVVSSHVATDVPVHKLVSDDEANKTKSAENEPKQR